MSKKREKKNFLAISGIVLVLSLALTLAMWRLAHPPLPLRMTTYIENGNRFLDEGRFPEASEMFRRALTFDGSNAQASYGHLKASLSWGYDALPLSAREARLRELSVQRPQDPHILTSLGDLSVARSALQEAADLYRRALALNRKLPYAHYQLGLAQLRMGKWSEAESNLRTAAALDPSRPEYGRNLTVAYIHSGNYQRALDMLGQRLKDNHLDTQSRLLYAKTLGLTGEFERSVSAAKYLLWILDNQLSDNQPWRFLLDNNFVFVVALSEKLAYTGLQTALSTYMTQEVKASQEIAAPTVLTAVVKNLFCADIRMLISVAHSLADTSKLINFVNRTFGHIGNDCRIRTGPQPYSQ